MSNYRSEPASNPFLSDLNFPSNRILFCDWLEKSQKIGWCDLLEQKYKSTQEEINKINKLLKNDSLYKIKLFYNNFIIQIDYIITDPHVVPLSSCHASAALVEL